MLQRVRQADERTIVVADGFSCREQIAQTTGRQALHPAQGMRMAIDGRDGRRNDAFPDRRLVRKPGICRAWLSAGGAVLRLALRAAGVTWRRKQ